MPTLFSAHFAFKTGRTFEIRIVSFMQEYTSKDFAKCFFNPLEKNLLKTYPRLNDLLPQEVPEDDLLCNEGEKLIKYVLALYDPKSPIIKDNPDYSSRKQAAAILAGYSLHDTTKLDTVYTCDSEYMVGFIVNFLRNVVQSRIWASLQADEQTYWEFIYRMMLPINREKGDKDQVQAVAVKTKLSEDKESILSRVESNLSKFLGEDEDLKKKVKKQDFSPEYMAGVK